ncbi:RimJ/RimL family protein N-acetyltransferase [Caulobacter ginsengisoli]|uniref:RimJ/RimL family protein N-acetyltransferase n=1 Tax=Caulobacter ginsengisoli TaxID=400775 RepID=A0ABU0INW7_9CAUL|nr:GNAT family N-acetyltransferase [Caulobacter ginsengisoli]MDQ0463654.1 RimJ/RimL family protein N-acetyltransferase [Caulobacter ginsengisoli]
MSLEPATEEDLPAIMRIERTPGYELFIGHWDLETHKAHMASTDARYFVWRDDGVAGFAILLGFDGPHPTVQLKRLGVGRPGKGLGTRFLRAVMAHVFETTDTHRFELQCNMANPRALHVYDREGFTVEGIKRDIYRMEDGSFSSSAFLSILRPEWAARAPGRP